MSVSTVPRLPTGGAGVKPLLGSANTVQHQVRVRLGTLVNPQKDLYDKSYCTLVDQASVPYWTQLH